MLHMLSRKSNDTSFPLHVYTRRNQNSFKRYQADESKKDSLMTQTKLKLDDWALFGCTIDSSEL